MKSKMNMTTAIDQNAGRITNNPVPADLLKGGKLKTRIVQKVIGCIRSTALPCIGLALVASSAYADVLSISDLRAMNMSAGMPNGTSVIVNEYYAGVNDGGRGGGAFRWRVPASAIGSPADDGGRFIVPAVNSSPAGVWERMLHGERPNVKMWGARGDGTTYDNEAINRAIPGLHNWGVGEVYFPAGNYLLTNTIVVNTTISKVTGEGCGNTTLTMAAGFGADIFRTYNANNALTGGIVDWDHNCVIRDLNFQFQNNTNNAAIVIAVPGEANGIQNVKTLRGGFGIRVYGGAAPGLKLHDVSTHDAAIAGVSFEPLPGQGYAVGGPHVLSGVSGDLRHDQWSAIGSLIRFSNVVAFASIDGLKAEGDFGGGVVQYKFPDTSTGWNESTTMGYVSIHNATYNGGVTYPGGNDYPRDFLVLKGGGRTPSTSIDMLNLYAVRYLIRDEVSGRNVDADINAFHGLAQMEGRIPVAYESWTIAGTNSEAFNTNSRLVKGQTAFAYLYATNSGWYRIAQTRGNGSDQAAGRVTISSFNRESTVIDFDVTANGGNPGGTYLNVVRSSKSGTAPVVTQARAYYFTDPTYGPWAAVDIYVGHPTSLNPPKLNRIAIALDINDNQNYDTPRTHLVGNPFPVNATLPSGAVSTTVNTYR